ncbi:MAG TPA: oxidoreductase [Terriglobales bacterium]|nr:oxidoreductase [Terriglobales bacterium]
MINVGLVGFGLAGKAFHAPFIRVVPGLRLVAIARRSAESDSTYPDVRFVSGVEQLLAIDDIDLIVIATPNDLHAPIARECLEAGRHVVIDKPFATTLAEAEELVALARQRDRILTVFQNRRWDGDFKTVRQLLRQGSLGRVVSYESHFDRFRPNLRGTWHERPQPGMGLLFDLGPHLIDQALVLFGKPERISADLRKERDGTLVNDAFEVVFHYPRLRALLRATVMAAASGPRFWICGTEGSFTKYGVDPQEQAMKQGGDPTAKGWGEEPESAWGTLTTVTETRTIPTAPGDYRGFYGNVRDAITGNAPLEVSSAQALNVMKALDLAERSSASGRMVTW